MAKKIIIEDVELGNSGEVSKDKINNNFGKVDEALDVLDGEAVKKINVTTRLGFSQTKVPSEFAVSLEAQRLQKEIDSKPNKEDVAISMINKGSVATVANLPTNATKGDAYYVESEGFIYQYDGSKWNKTVFTAFPSDVATKSDMEEKADKESLQPLPVVKTENEMFYNNVSLDDKTSSGGDFTSTFYANGIDRIQDSCILKSVTVKSAGNGVATLKVIQVLSIIDNKFDFKILHTYTTVSIISGINTYDISDEYIIPANSFIGISCNPAVVNFGSDTLANNYRFTINELTQGTKTPVSPALNFNVYKTEIASDILTETKADTIYAKGSVDIVSDMVENYGYIDKNGILRSVGSDTNWVFTKRIYPTQYKELIFHTYGVEATKAIVYYRADNTAISTESTIGNTLAWFKKVLDMSNLPEGTAYIRSSFRNPEKEGIISSISASVDVIKSIKELQDSIGEKNNIPYIYPKTIYTVSNDCNTALKGKSRNYAQSVFLDHLFNGFNKEMSIQFENHKDTKQFNGPMRVTDSNESNPTVEWNKGLNLLEQNVSVKVKGNDIAESSFIVKHRSSLNSASKSITPKVLCIGDSVTYGELALLPDDNFTQNNAYHLVCKELFMKDKIDSGLTDGSYEVQFLGHFRKQKTFSYKDSDYTAISFHEGIRGINLNQYLNGGVAAFKSSTTNKFSINAWLDQYRTLDDTGNRLTLGNGTGSLITAGNLNSIDVCTPTHIVIMLGANDKASFNIEYYKELVTIIKTEYPNMIIGLAMLDTAGTYFPSLHKDCPDNAIIWNNADANELHTNQYNNFKKILDYYDNSDWESQNVFIVPFYFVQPTYNTFSSRILEQPYGDKILEPFGWGSHVHINGIGHTHWAYCLYSWLKYTIVK